MTGLSRVRVPLPSRLRGAAAVLCAFAFFGATACSPPKAENVVPTAGTFTGPWADDIAHVYSSFESDFGHAALADSIVSDMEFQEGMTLIKECYESAGFSVQYDQYGYETVTSLNGDGDATEAMAKCSAADGGVSILYYMMKANPQNQPIEDLVAQCLVREGIAEPGFTGQDYADAMASGDVPWTPGDKRVDTCSKDPLGLINGTGD